MTTLFVLILGIAAVAAAPSNNDRIVGGSLTTISSYPYSAVLLYSYTTLFHTHLCGSAIINNRSVLTAGHCITINARFRTRVGSSYSSWGGTIYDTSRLQVHPSYRQQTMDSDIAVLRIVGTFTFSNNVRDVRIAGASYNLADNQAVWAIGWGATSSGGVPSPQLRHVQVRTVNQDICRERYGQRGRVITANMLCSGWLEVGGRDQCQGDSGSPLIHNSIVVGVCSFGRGCGSARYPGVNARVSRFASWIQSNG